MYQGVLVAGQSQGRTVEALALDCLGGAHDDDGDIGGGGKFDGAGELLVGGQPGFADHQADPEQHDVLPPGEPQPHVDLLALPQPPGDALLRRGADH